MNAGSEESGTSLSSRARSAGAAIVGVLLILNALAYTWKSCHDLNKLRTIDLMPLYSGSRLVRAGGPLYAPGVTQAEMLANCPAVLTGGFRLLNDLDCNPYPPSTLFVMLPLSILPYEPACLALSGLLLGTLGAGIWIASCTFAPSWSRSSRLIAVGAGLSSITVKWSIELLQTAPLVCGLLLLFIAALQRGWLRRAWLWGSLALALKVTVGVPCLAFALLQRRFRLAAAIVGVWVLINGIGFMITGGAASFRDYRNQVARQQAMELNAPDPHLPKANSRLDWEYLLNGFRPARAVWHRLGILLTTVSLLFLVISAMQLGAYRRDPRLMITFSGPVACLSLLSVYHHEYDACLLLLPLLLYAAAPKEIGRFGETRWFLGLGFWYAIAHPAFGPTSAGIGAVLGLSPMVAERMAGAACVTALLAVSLRLLYRLRTCCHVFEERSQPKGNVGF